MEPQELGATLEPPICLTGIAVTLGTHRVEKSPVSGVSRLWFQKSILPRIMGRTLNP